jgi:hypothetical protein
VELFVDVFEPFVVLYPLLFDDDEFVVLLLPTLEVVFVVVFPVLLYPPLLSSDGEVLAGAVS